MLCKDFYSKYKDSIVLVFNIETKSLKVINPRMLPLSIANREHTYDMIRVFCSSRLLMMNREYCKEILTACGICDQSDVNICIMSRALSFRDNYWICAADSNETWKTINLYNNEFSIPVGKVALTGDMDNITVENIIDDQLYTGELTNKGTRAKCYMREDGNIYLLKSESYKEIASEVISPYIAYALGLDCAIYKYIKRFGQDCSVCQITTSETREMIPCRDVMEYYGESKMNSESMTYNAFIGVDAINFIKMQLFDYITLNIDRNRDNYGLLSQNGKFVSLYPVFDHDFCFKGKSVEGFYFPSGLTFKKTLSMIKLKYSQQYQFVYSRLLQAKSFLESQNFKGVFLKYKTQKEYDGMMGRVNDLL